MLTQPAGTSGRNTPSAGKVVAHRRRTRSGTPGPPPGEGGLSRLARSSSPWSTRSRGAIGPGAPSSSQRPSRPHRRPRTQLPRPPPVGRPVAPNFDDEDTPKPLYRDEYLPQTLYRPEPTASRTETPPAPAVNGGSAHPPAAPPRPDADDVGSDDTAIRSFTFAPRTRRTGDETTTILTRSGSTARGRSAPSGPSGPDDIDDYEDADDSRPIGERARWALAIGVIAAVVVLGLAIGYAVLRLGDGRDTAPPPAETAGSVGPAPTTSASEPPTTGGAALLTNDLMVSAAQAKPLDPKRTWKEALTQRGASEDAPVPACFGLEPAPTASPSRSRRSCGC